MKKSEGKVVPKKAPSTVWKRELGGVYTSRQEGQNSLTNGKDFTGIAVYARAGAKVLKLVLFSHLLYTWSRGDVALMYESVEEFSRALYHAEVGCYAEMSAVACPSVARCPLVAQYLIFLLFLRAFRRIEEV